MRGHWFALQGKSMSFHKKETEKNWVSGQTFARNTFETSTLPECELPQAMSLILFDLSASMSLGVSQLSLEQWPSFPSSPSPQEKTRPSTVNAIECFPPEWTATFFTTYCKEQVRNSSLYIWWTLDSYKLDLALKFEYTQPPFWRSRKIYLTSVERYFSMLN